MARQSMAHAAFQTDSGESVLVDQRSEDLGYEVSIARGDASIETGVEFSDAIERAIRPVANTFVKAVQAINPQPSEVSVQFGIRLHYREGAVVSSSSEGSHFNVTVMWARE